MIEWKTQFIKRRGEYMSEWINKEDVRDFLSSLTGEETLQDLQEKFDNLPTKTIDEPFKVGKDLFISLYKFASDMRQAQNKIMAEPDPVKRGEKALFEFPMVQGSKNIFAIDRVAKLNYDSRKAAVNLKEVEQALEDLNFERYKLEEHEN